MGNISSDLPYARNVLPFYVLFHSPKSNQPLPYAEIGLLGCAGTSWDALLGCLVAKQREEMKEYKHSDIPYVPFRFSNGDVRPELLIRSRYLLFKSTDKWVER